MRLNRTALRSSVVLCACLAGAVFAARLSWTTIAHAEDRAAMRDAMRQAPSAVPTLQVYSRETVVDVTVTDKDGKPVHGLTRDDFTVKEDGKPQAIRGFEEFGADAPAASAPPKLPPHVYTNLQPPPASGAVNVMLLDFLNIAAMPGIEILGAEDAQGRAFAAQNTVKREAKKYVATMPAGTRVIVLGLSNSLRTLQGLTSDPALIGASLDTLDYNAQGRVATYQEFCAQAELRTRMTLEAMNQIAADLAGTRGKKNLLWFSVGIPWLTDPSAHAECLPDYSSDLLKTYGLLAAAQVTVDPIDARGVTTMPNAFITSTGALWENIPALPAPQWIAASRAYMQKTAEEELAMESIAEATGGTAYYNSNDLAAQISKAIDKGSHYYTLTYVPPGKKYDWGHHSIKVTVEQPGLHLLYRRSYDAVDPATIQPPPALAMGIEPARSAAAGPVDMRAEMGRSMPTSQGVLFDVQVEPSTETVKPGDPAVFGVLDVKLKAKPLARYGFTYAFPGREIVLKPADDGTQRGSLEFDLAAYDGDGNVVTSLRQAIELNLTAEQAAQLAHSPFRYFQQLDLPAGALFVRVGVLDRTANKVGTVEIPVTVAKPVHTAAQ
jgi:VWFA-related protein